MLQSQQMPTNPTGRRGFLKAVALASSGAAQTPPQTPAAPTPPATPHPPQPVTLPRSSMRYPRIYTGRQLAMLAMPLGGIAAGSISLGGRGQLRDWEIFNRPDKGRSPEYAFASIWAQAGSRKPVAHVLEARLMPPYEGPDGLGSKNAPGLSRLEGATFTGEFPIAQIAFRDSRLPVNVTLDAFSPFIPLDADESGLPVAILRYRVHNPGKDAARVSIAWSIENPIDAGSHDPVYLRKGEQRVIEYRESGQIKGLLMSSPGVSRGEAFGCKIDWCWNGNEDRMRRSGTVAVINFAMVAIATEDDGFTIIELLSDWNIEVGDAIAWSNGHGLGHEIYENVTKSSRATVYVQNHAVNESSLREQLLF